VGAPSKRPATAIAPRLNFLRGRAFRRIAIGAAAALLVAGIGAAIAFRRQALSDAWTGLRRHTLPDAWNATRRQTSETWIAVRHHASEAWIAVRRHTPFDVPDVKPSASVSSATSPSRVAVREATPERATRRRAQHSGGGKAKKRSRDD
jgi:hypothetical protein